MDTYRPARRAAYSQAFALRGVTTNDDNDVIVRSSGDDDDNDVSDESIGDHDDNDVSNESIGQHDDRDGGDSDYELPTARPGF